MPVVELSEEDVALLEAAKKVGGLQGIDLGYRARVLHDKLFTHKETAVPYQQAIKKVLPNARVPDDVAAPYVERIEAVDKKLTDHLDALAKEKEESAKSSAQAKFDEQWNGVVSSYNLTDEGQEKLISFMKNRQLVDPEAAAALYFKQNPVEPAPVVPSSIAPQGWARDIGILHEEDDKSSKLLISNPEAWADQEAAAVLTETRRQAA